MLLLTALRLSAQVCPSCSTVAATSMQGAGQALASGTIVITASTSWTATDGTLVEPVSKTVSVSNGAFSVLLEPNDQSTSLGTFYQVVYHLSNAIKRNETWVVPTSSVPLTVSQVVYTTPPIVPTMIGPQAIFAKGISDGSYCLNVVAGIVTGLTLCSGGTGGTTALSFAALTSTEWSNLTSTQWSALAQ